MFCPDSVTDLESSSTNTTPSSAAASRVESHFHAFDVHIIMHIDIRVMGQNPATNRKAHTEKKSGRSIERS